MNECNLSAMSGAPFYEQSQLRSSGKALKVPLRMARAELLLFHELYKHTRLRMGEGRGIVIRGIQTAEKMFCNMRDSMAGRMLYDIMSL